MRVYLDNCCYNRPYDDQGQILVFLETQAKLEIQRRIKQGEIELVSSYMLDFEQDQNPYVKQKFAIEKFIRDYASYYVDYDKSSIILTRPIVEAGENLGFLPGALEDKINPYLRPLYDAMHLVLPRDTVKKLCESSAIEIAPLAYMRGRTLTNAVVILDEAQNTTVEQMKMFLTRLGENSRMVINGDLSQVDLPRGTVSGLKDAIDTLTRISGISSVTFSANDVVRHGLVAKIVKAYEEKKHD